METLERLLAEHPFFSELDRAHLDLLVGCGSNCFFPAGSYLFKEDEPANQLYVIRHGKVALEVYAPAGGSVTVDTIESGEVLGWSWLVAPYRWHFDARAIEPVRATALDAECLRTKIETDHELGFQLLRRFIHVLETRLRATRIQMLDLYGQNHHRR